MTSHSDLSCCNSTLVERSLAIKLCIVDFSSCSPSLLVCNSTRNLLLSFSSWLTLPSARRLKQDMEWVNAMDGCGSIQFLFCRHMLLPANSRENLAGRNCGLPRTRSATIPVITANDHFLLYWLFCLVGMQLQKRSFACRFNSKNRYWMFVIGPTKYYVSFMLLNQRETTPEKKVKHPT